MDTYPFGVIIVEADQVDCEAFVRGLRWLEPAPSILVFETPELALRALCQPYPLFLPGVPFVILLGRYLPGMDEFVFLAQLRREAGLRTTPVFLLDDSDGCERVSDQQLGIAGYLNKPAATTEARRIAAQVAAYVQRDRT